MNSKLSLKPTKKKIILSLIIFILFYLVSLYISYENMKIGARSCKIDGGCPAANWSFFEFLQSTNPVLIIFGYENSVMFIGFGILATILFYFGYSYYESKKILISSSY